MGSNRTFLSLPPRRGSRRSSSFTCSFRQRKSLHSSSTSIYTRQSMDQVRFYLPCSSSHFSLPHTHLCVSPRSFSFCRRFLSRCLQSGHLSLSPYSSLCFRQRSPSALNSPSLSSSSAVQVYPPPSLAQTDGSSSFSSSLSREYGTSFHTCPSFSFSPSFSSPCSSSARSRSEVCVSTGTSPAALGHSPHISLLLSSLSSLSPLSSSSSPFSSSSSASRYRVYSDWSVWYVPVTSASFHRKPLELLRVPGNPLAFHASSSSSPSSSPPSTSSSLSSSERCVPSLPESGALKKDEERQEERQEEREEKEKEKEEEVEGISPVSSLSVGRSHGVLAVDGKVFALGLEYTKGQMGLSPSSPLFRSSLSSFKHKTSFSSTLLSFFSSLLPSSFFSSPLGTSSSLSRERMMPPRLVPVDPPEGGWKGKVVKVACGATHTCAITDLGCMYTWGSPNGWFNGSPLGLGDTKPRFRPTLVQDFVKREESVVDVACGMDWTLCATHRGDLYVSGASEFGVQGRGPAEGSSSTSKFFPISFFKTLHPSTSSPPFTTQDLEDRDNDDDDYTNKENREKTTPTSSQHLHPRQQGDFDLHSFPSSSFCFSSPLDRGKLGGVRDEEEEKEKGFDGRNLEKVSQLLLEKRKDARYVDETPSSSSSSSFLSRQEEMSRHLRYFSPRKEEEERAGSCRSWRDSSSERKEFSSLNKEEREKLLAGRRRSREGDSHIRNGMMDYPERTRRRGDDGKKRKEEEEKDKENSIMEKSYVPHEFYSPIRTPTVDYVDSKEEEKKRERKRERFRFLDLSCGRRHCVVVTQDGRVWTWGCNLNGELGRNVGEAAISTSRYTESYSSYPLLLHSLIRAGVRIKHVAGGLAHTLALSDDGRLFSWGRQAAGGEEEEEKDLGERQPRLVHLHSKYGQSCMRGQVTKIATGGWDCEGISFLQTPKDYNLALTDSGDLYAWGPGLRHALPHWSYENLKQDKHLSYKKREKEEEEVKGRDSPFDLERKKGMEQVKSGEREEKDENEEEEEKKKKRKRFFSSIEDEAEERKKEKEEETQRQETFFTERRDFGRHPMKIRKEKLFLKRRGKEEEKEEGRDESWNPEDLLIRDVACGPLGVLLLVEKKNLP